jgi:hypothetical protein
MLPVSSHNQNVAFTLLFRPFGPFGETCLRLIYWALKAARTTASIFGVNSFRIFTAV